MSVVINTSVSESRGTPRIWFEGAKLVKGGFEPGAEYHRTISHGKVTLRVVKADFQLRNDNSKIYVVSSRTRNGVIAPIIDINTKDLSAAQFDEVGKDVRCVVRNGVFVISNAFLDDRIVERIQRMFDKIDNGDPLRMASAYHGIGVMDSALHKGFAAVGLTTKLSMAIEVEPVYLNASIRNNPELWDRQSIAIESAIEKLNFADTNGRFKSEFWSSGIPCTGMCASGRAKNKLTHGEDHSSAGTSAGTHYVLNGIQSCNPAVCIFENVVEYSNSASASILRSVLRASGYTFTERLIHGSEFGAFEDRKRWVMVVITAGLEDFFDINDMQVPGKNTGTLADIQENIPLDDKSWKEYEYLKSKERADIKAGKGFRRQLITPDQTKVGSLGRLYQKARSTEAQWLHPEDPEKTRLFTKGEHAAVKTIPPHLINGLSTGRAHEGCGQGVIYNAFVEIGSFIGSFLMEQHAKQKQHEFMIAA